MTITLAGIELPSDLEWVDQYDWSPIVQSKKYTLTGALVVPEAKKLKGRPITLEGDNASSWVTKSVLDLLTAKADTANLTMVLSYHGTTFDVMFSREQTPISSRLIVPFANPQSTDVYSLKLRLMQV